MQFTRAMIDLVKEIRRRSSAVDKPSIKLANPELFHELTSMFHRSNDAVFKALIKELFFLAGNEWTEKLSTEKKEEIPAKTSTAKWVTKFYRGQGEAVKLNDKSSDKKPSKPVRIYRGQVVA